MDATLDALADPLTANARALELRAQGQTAAAREAFRRAIARFPSDARLHANHAFVLAEAGALDAALEGYDAAVRCAPGFLEAHVARGLLAFRMARNDEAEHALRSALAIDPYEVRANLALYELLHVKGQPEKALPYQRRALERRTLFSTVAPVERRSVLVLCTPGDLQANVPVDFLFDGRTTSVHKLYLLDAERLASVALPRYDVVFNAIAESPSAGRALALAERFLAAQPRPVINRPERVVRTNRLQLVDALRGTGCRLAPIAVATRAELGDGSPIPFPIIIRPVGSHAGHGLQKVDDAPELAEYVGANDAQTFFVSAFVDYRSADGYYRKYRVICVDGEPYPCHLAISPRWMIHYYNAPMAEHGWMRDEEARFLADLGSVFADGPRRALRELSAALELEYVGIDCALDGNGELLVFEADPAMVVHLSDSLELYPYKHEFVPRIFRAVERMLDQRAQAR
jgi:tetratricopeptide (TPR) repeat protein